MVDNAGNESSIDVCNATINKNAIDKAANALKKAETSKTQEDLDIAKELINTLPNSTEKTDLLKRADNLQKIIDGINAISAATNAMTKAENSKAQKDLDTAAALINALPDGTEKSDLIKRADSLQKIISSNAIIAATNAMTKAENTKAQKDLDTAVALINDLPDCIEKSDLMKRANSLQKIINGNNAISVATSAMTKAENTNTQKDLDVATALINELPNCTEKSDLLKRANSLQKIINDNGISVATSAMTKAENTKVQDDLDTAYTLIYALPDCTEKTNLMKRADNLQKLIGDNNAISAAINAMTKAESTKAQKDLEDAVALINALPDGSVKTDLLNRVNILQGIINGKNVIIVTADSNEIVRTQMVNFVIKTSDVQDLYTIQLKLKYDTERLELDELALKNLAWENDLNGYEAVKVNSSAGEIEIIYSKKGNVQGLNGETSFIKVPFKATRIGKTKFVVSDIKLISSTGKRIEASITSATKEINIIANPLNIVLTGEKGQDDWYVSPVKVEINDVDAKELFYTLNGVKNNYTEPFTINEVGKHNLIAAMNDGFGYTMEKEQMIKIDTVSPIISVNNTSTDWKNDVKVMPQFDDQNGSGISQKWYQWE